MIASCAMLDPDCFEYHAGFLRPHEADHCLAELWSDLDWEQREIRLFGRPVMQPRLIAWYGDSQAEYRYSGLTLDPSPWQPLLKRLKSRIEEFCGERFNSVLANAYRNGNDSMGWHSDNEVELGDCPLIASLSLGASRRFLVRPSGRVPVERRQSSGVDLENGSLLVMKGCCQQNYQHALPKTRREVGLRINLTYRLVLNQAPD